MHKSWGNAIEFDEAAERMGVDVMRWMFAKARPEENILFGWHAADEARRELLVLWNVYAFFVTYARLAGWTPGRDRRRRSRLRRAWPALDRWILSRAGAAWRTRSRTACATTTRSGRRARSARSSTTCRRGTCACRATGCARARRRRPIATRRSRRSTRRSSRSPGRSRRSCRSCPRRCTRTSWSRSSPGAPDSVHLTRWPAAELAAHRDEALERSMAIVRGAVELARTLRAQAGLRTRQPLARAWLALPAAAWRIVRRAARGCSRTRSTCKAVELIGDESELVERRVKPLLPKIGKRLGSAIPAVMAAAREGAVEFHDDGSVTLAGETLARRRGRDPGDAAAGHGGRARRGPRGRARHRADARAPRRGRRPRAPAGDPGPAPGGRARARRPDRGVGRGRAGGGRGTPAGDRAETLADDRGGRDRRPTRHEPRVELDGGPVRDRPAARARHDGVPRRPTSASHGRARWPLFIGLAATVLVVDQIVKAWLVASSAEGQRLSSHRRPRPAGPPRTAARCSGCSAIRRSSSRSCRSASSGLIVWYHGSRAGTPCCRWRSGLLLGGALGNLIDRLRLGLRRRLHGRRHRRPALLHVQRRRRRDQPARSCCCSRARCCRAVRFPRVDAGGPAATRRADGTVDA